MVSVGCPYQECQHNYINNNDESGHNISNISPLPPESVLNSSTEDLLDTSQSDIIPSLNASSASVCELNYPYKSTESCDARLSAHSSENIIDKLDDLSYDQEANLYKTTSAAFIPNTHRTLIASRSSPLSSKVVTCLETSSNFIPILNKSLVASDQKPLLAHCNRSRLNGNTSLRQTTVTNPDTSSGDDILPSTHKSKLFLSTKSALVRKPLSVQRSSPTLHRPLNCRTPTTPPKSPLVAQNSSQKLSCSKIIRVSPSQFKYSYSQVPKSDSAYSDELLSFSPVPRGYSPYSDFPSSYSSNLTYEQNSFDGNNIYSRISKSDSACSEQYTSSPFRPISSVPKSHSTIFRSDSAYSEIEYSYSTIPQSDSCYFEKDLFPCLPKSNSTYSENILLTTCEKEEKEFLPRSFSSYSQLLLPYKPSDDNQVCPEIGSTEVSESCTSINPDDRSGKVSTLLTRSASVDLEEESNSPFIPKSHSSYHCVDQSSTMPTLKSIFKTPRQSDESREKKSNGRGLLPRDTSVPSFKLHGKSENKIRKSHTVLALSSDDSSAGYAATKLLPSSLAADSTCSSSNCLSKHFRNSISQSLNQSIGNLDADPERKRPKRRSQIFSFLPSSISRNTSIAPSIISAKGSYLGSFLGSSEESDTLYCKLCLMDVPIDSMCQLTTCQCRYCKYCMANYTKVRIEDGYYTVPCPDASCDASSTDLTDEQVAEFAGPEILNLRNTLRLSAEVAADPYRVFCPRPGCETIVYLNRPKHLPPDIRTKSSKSKISKPHRHPKSVNPMAITHLKDSSASLPTPPIVTNKETPVFMNRSSPAPPSRNLTLNLKSHNELLFKNQGFQQSRSTLSDKTTTKVLIERSSDVTDENYLMMNKNSLLEDTGAASSSYDNEKTNGDDLGALIGDKSAVDIRKLSLDEVNVIKCIGSSTVSQDSEDNSEYPSDPALSAAMAALQSPAEYRSFADLQTSSYNSTLDGAPSQFGVAECPSCLFIFCPSCGEDSHPNKPCKIPITVKQRLKIFGVPESLEDVIKCCPQCHVCIERNEGCAQMQCRACKHTFCWYCLTSLEEDILLRHYDKGPCRNKLGHSRASVLCHRLQVLAIFLGVGLLVIAASPLLALIGPCALCFKCCTITSEKVTNMKDNTRR